MGLFDFFRKRNPVDRLKKYPPALRQSFELLFPNGVVDHDRQINELYNHFCGKFSREIIDSNAIFVLAGYLITGDSKSKETAVAKLMNRLNTPLSQQDAEYIHDYVISQHPKLSVLEVVAGQERVCVPQMPDECDGIIFTGYGVNKSTAFIVRNIGTQSMEIPLKKY